MRKISQKIEVHPFEEKILQSYDLAKKEMSSKNYKLFERYDMAMIGDTIATSTRYHQLAIIENAMKKQKYNQQQREKIRELLFQHR